ncbi:S8 family serine peptidase [Streptomyces sp. YS415]|uniref:S8 family serine peptidase n=1 Tax=Streptomyces sp. YS415 TaxID=2944806 RepID=UPI0020229803|nr:S8 family serine peptidase [Streptomyces sp. YS415]MCL7430174.1 S8 family serine peptidase [Streptomyces sp. YS415]
MPKIPLPRPGPVAFAVATALALGLLPTTAAVSASPEGPVPPVQTSAPVPQPPGSGRAHTVTLITGDKVTVATAADGTEVRSFQGANGTTTGFTRTVVDGSTYVYPDSVLPYVAAGKLDRRLFDVTRLIADGHDDAHSSGLPLIIGYTKAAAESRRLPEVPGSRVERRLDSVRGASLTQERARAGEFWESVTGGPDAARRSSAPVFAGGVAKIWLDGKVTADLAESTAQIGAPEVWSRGTTGGGVKVAVLDTGVDPDHPDLADRIDGTASFVPYDAEIADYNGHGTHVASTIAGTGDASGGQERGVAPGARLEVGKVLDDEGRGDESWIIAGMEWAARDRQAEIVNLSMGSSSGDPADPLSQAVDRLSRETGALFVVAAGNAGAPRTISSPGAADAALTVGAVDSADRLAEFSSQGPRKGDAGLKPEITAPGVGIVAARSSYPRGSGDYTTMSGTSMAAPHVSGSAALLAALHPDWSGQQLKEALVSSARATPAYTPFQAGGGRLDVASATRTTVFATSSVHSGLHAWPTEPGATRVRKVTYTNTGDVPVALDLAVGSGVPAGLFSLSADRVTVPPRGTAAVSLTVHLDRLPADQPVAGVLTGTDSTGAVRTRTLVGAAKEGPRHDLTITAKDRSGTPVTGKVALVADRFFTSLELNADGTATTRLPASSYSGWLTADVRGVNGRGSKGMALLSFTDVRLDRDRTVTLDGQRARQVRAHVPQRTTMVAPRVDIHRSYADSLVESSVLPDASYDSVWALPTAGKVTYGKFEFGTRLRLEQPALTVGTRGRTYGDLLVKRGAEPLPAGTRFLPVVLAGDGSAPARSWPKARGKAVVVRRSDTVTVEEQARSAAAAGARLLLVVHDGTGRLQPWDETPYSPPSPAPLTVATLTAGQGADLMAAVRHGRDRLTVTSHPATGYLYDVVRHWTGAVPADPTWRAGHRDLARVDVSFRNPRQAKAREFRADVWQGWTVGNTLTAPAHGERTDWVTAGNSAWVEDAGVNGEITQQSLGPVRYQAGRTERTRWFGPVLRPRMAPLGYHPTRHLDTVYIPAPGWGDSGGGHVGDTYGNPGVRNRAALWQGSRLLHESGTEYLQVSGLAARRLQYRLVVDNDRGTWAGPYSTRTRTEWDFTSAATDGATSASLPLIQLDYGVDTDRAGRADRHTALTVSASHLPGTDAAVGKLVLDVSYDDGTTWRRAGLDRRDGAWRTALHAPKGAGYVTLRVTARDGIGNGVTQTITRAFGLR